MKLFSCLSQNKAKYFLWLDNILRLDILVNVLFELIWSKIFSYLLLMYKNYDAWKKCPFPPIHNVSNKRVFLLWLFLANQSVHLFILFQFVFTPNKSRPNTNTFPMAVKDKLHKLLSCLIFTSQLSILVIFLHISTHIVLKRICAFVLTIYYKMSYLQ